MSALRKQKYKLLAVANRELGKLRAGWEEDDYREVLRQCGAQEKAGKFSATTMSEQQLDAALRRFKALGFKVKRKVTPIEWRAPRIAKLNALWCAMADEGFVRDRSERAMEVFLKHQVRGFTRLRWATSTQLNQGIETLKGMAKQRGMQVS